jgi:hypothetical protein
MHIASPIHLTAKEPKGRNSEYDIAVTDMFPQK